MSGHGDGCSVTGCARTSQRRGWCFTHYARWRKDGETGPAEIRVRKYGDTECYADGCDNKAKKVGLCKMHAARLSRHGHVGAAEKQHAVRYDGTECSVNDCARPAASRGWCKNHYKRASRWGDPTASRPTRERMAPPLTGEPVSAQGLEGCTVQDCGKTLVARGMCRTHYMQWLRATPTEIRIPAQRLKRLSVLERFEQKVIKSGPGDCWIYTGSSTVKGYGTFYVSPERGRVPAHTFSVELATGERCPSGKEGCHRCDNPPCVNPAHIYYGTRQQNVDDMWRRGRVTARPIDPEKVWTLYQSGAGATKIASELGVGLERLYRTMNEIGLKRRPVGRVPRQGD